MSFLRTATWILLAVALNCVTVYAQMDEPYFGGQPASKDNSATAASIPLNLPETEHSSRLSAVERAIGELNASFATGVTSFGQDALGNLTLQFLAPFRFARENPFKAALGVAGILSLIATDHQTYPRLTVPIQSPLRREMQQVSNTGDRRNGIYLIAGLGLAGMTTGSRKQTETSLMLAHALLTSAIWTSTIKTLAGRERPREMEEQYSDWEGPSFLNHDHPQHASLRSFPSGHSSGAWAIATVLANQYPTRGIIPLLSYGGAATISYSRIAVGAHWLSDVVVGAIIGIASAQQVISSHGRRETRSRNARRVKLGVNVSSQYKGIHLKVNF